LATKLSALEVLHNICNMGTHDLPDMYAHNPRALDIHIRQITCAHVATIKCIILTEHSTKYHPTVRNVPRLDSTKLKYMHFIGFLQLLDTLLMSQ